ncbi:MAG TPA: histidine kinase [Verrucomicrobiae bacterium]|nr:histidine kinase [Verrucomicrobiae bacterium]
MLWLGFWTLIGLSFASQFYISSYKAGAPVTWSQAVVWALGDWYVFALLSLPASWLARRFHFERGNWPGQLPVHLAGSVLFSLAFMVLRAWGALWQANPVEGPVTFAGAFKTLLVKTWHFNLLVYWAIVSVQHAFDYYRKFQERELRAVELEKRLAQARLQALQMQLNPHFLFNALNSIAALMHKDVEAADRMLTRLADLLRRALDSTGEQEVSLERELDFLRRYLEIEQTRFGPRLTVEFDTPAETLAARVPNLILQPLVENAIKHGIEPRARPGRIWITARRDADRLHLEVRDNGNGLAANSVERVGTANTRSRLVQLYGERQQFELRNEPSGGLAARVTLPFRLQPDGD